MLLDFVECGDDRTVGPFQLIDCGLVMEKVVRSFLARGRAIDGESLDVFPSEYADQVVFCVVQPEFVDPYVDCFCLDLNAVLDWRDESCT